MSVDISKYVDVSSERRSPVWNHMLLYKEKGDALCKLCLDKKITKTVYAKNGSTKTILDHLRLIHGIGKNATLVNNDPSQKSCSEIFQEEEESVIEDVSKLCVDGLTFRNIAESTMMHKLTAVSWLIS